jgi:hypothetical protein
VAPGLTVVAGGGARDALLELTTDDLLRATDARAADLTEGAPPEALHDAPTEAFQEETER